MKNKALFIFSIIFVSFILICEGFAIAFLIAVSGASMAVVDGVANSVSDALIFLIPPYYAAPLILLIIALIVIFKKMPEYNLHIAITSIISACIPIFTFIIYSVLGVGLIETPDLWTVFPVLQVIFSILLFFILKLSIKRTRKVVEKI